MSIDNFSKAPKQYLRLDILNCFLAALSLKSYMMGKIQTFTLEDDHAVSVLRRLLHRANASLLRKSQNAQR